MWCNSQMRNHQATPRLPPHPVSTFPEIHVPTQRCIDQIRQCITVTKVANDTCRTRVVVLGWVYRLRRVTTFHLHHSPKVISDFSPPIFPWSCCQGNANNAPGSAVPRFRPCPARQQRPQGWATPCHGNPGFRKEASSNSRFIQGQCKFLVRATMQPVMFNDFFGLWG